MIIYITEPDEIADEAKKLLTDAGHVTVTDQDLPSVDPQEIKGLFIRSYTHVDKTFLDKYPSLSYVLRAGVGTDRIDTAECDRRGIRVINAPGSNANAVAEYVIGVAIMLIRNITYQMKQITEGCWRDRDMAGGEIRGKMIGIIGCGAIGQSIAQKLQPFSPADLLGYDPYIDAEGLASKGIRKSGIEQILGTCDIITLHLPLTPETRGLISRREFSLMKPTAYLINAARGGIVNETDLIEAVSSGRIAGAALDVFESEPHVHHLLRGHDKLLLTPHIAGFTREADVAMSTMPVKELLRHVKMSG